MRPTLRKVVLIVLLDRDQPCRKRRSVWVQGWLKSRKQAGEFHRLIQELRLFGEEFRSYFRLDRSQFDHLLQMVGDRIARMDTNYREFLATGDSYRTIGFSFRVGRSTVAGIVPSVAQDIWDCLVGKYMPVLKEEDWRAIAAEFLERPRVLHNYLWRASQEPLRMEMGTPNGHLPNITRAGVNNAPRQALQVREKLTTYFSSPAGEVPWQHAVE
ncbi:unnamed protein product [Coregonus sp. 'balchen']|nr:unnamed protein product [Coregonus sp. 'balchen']